MSQRVVKLERDRGKYRKGDMVEESKREQKKSEHLRTNKKNTLKLL